MLQPKYGSGSGVNHPNDLRLDIDSNRAIDEVDPKLRLKSYNPNIDLELHPELTPKNDLKLIHTRDQSWSWGGP